MSSPRRAVRLGIQTITSLSGLLLLLGGLGLCGVANATIFFVTTFDDELNSDGDCSLREAIEASNIDANVDNCGIGSVNDLIFVPEGTYTLSLLAVPNEDDLNQVGDLDIRANLIIRGMGNVPSRIVSGPISTRVAHVRCSDSVVADIDVVFDNLDLSGGGAERGGTLLLEDCTNGAVEAEVHFEMVDSRVSGGTATLRGGGIADETGGFVTIRNSVITESGVVASGSLEPAYGGGLSIAGGGLTTVEDCEIVQNVTVDILGPSSGAGIYVSSPTNIRRSLIVSNSAIGDAGGIYCENTSMNLDNSTVADNYATGDGGGYYAGAGCLASLDSVTIAENQAARGGGLYVGAGNAVLENSLLALNTASFSPDLRGVVTSDDYNLIGIADGSTGVSGPNDLAGTAASPVDPGLGPLAANGLARRSYFPASNGPAVDSGATPKLEDQFGRDRPNGSADDRGAVELQQTNAYFNYYVDLGTFVGSPSSAYGAAAGVAGVWNSVGLGTHSLVDIAGDLSDVALTVASASDFTFGTSATNDLARVHGDEVFDCTGNPSGETWSLSFSGLYLNEYTVYLYSAARLNTTTGAVTIAGVAAPPELPGDAFALIEGETYQGHTVVAEDTLVISGLETGPECAGIAGIQIVPEPAMGASLGMGLMMLAGASSSRRRWKR